MSVKILACPYCGSDCVDVKFFFDVWCGKCINCSAAGPEARDKSDAILLWNAAANALAKKNAEIEKLCKERHTMCIDYERVEQELEKLRKERDKALRVAKLFHGGIKAIARYANDWIVILDTDTRTEPPSSPVDATESDA